MSKFYRPSIVLATGLPELEKLISSNIDADFLGVALYKEAVLEVLERKQPDIVFISELLDGVMEMRPLILSLRTRVPNTRIIFIMANENPEFRSFLYQWMVFDVFSGSLSIKEIQESIESPKNFEDIAKELEVLKRFEKKGEDFDENDIDLIGNFSSDNYTRLGNKTLENSELYRQVVSFWSVQDGAGKTFSAINTALSLANRNDLKILLIDFNIENPTVSLYYNFVDPDRNLGAIVDDLLLEREITADNFEDYLIPHPLYNNLHILPGYILKMKRQDSEFMINVFNFILELADKNNYSTVLIDTEAGLSPLNKEIFNKSSKVLLHIAENPSSLNAVIRFFDTQYGPFVSSLLDKSKISPVITRYHNDTITNFKRIVHSVLELEIVAYFPESDKVRISIQRSEPLLSKKINDEIYLACIKLSNTIHPRSFQEPIIKTITEPEEEIKKTPTQLDVVTSKVKNIFNKKKK